MTALFADTFYRIALADFTDSAHQRALALTTEHAVDASSWRACPSDRDAAAGPEAMGRVLSGREPRVR